MKKLLVISNHPVEKWSDEQKEGWDIIEYIPFPNVSPQLGRQAAKDAAISLLDTIRARIENIEGVSLYRFREYDGDYNLAMWWETVEHVPSDWKLSIQGEFSLCNELFQRVGEHCVFPTTERVVEEKDGVKTSTFKFVRWR